MCIAVLAALCTPVAASESNNTPPAKQEFRIIKDSDLKNEMNVSPIDKTTAEVNGQESSTAREAHGGYIVISSAGLLLLIILLIILL